MMDLTTSRFEIAVGEELWRKLLAEGGFCWDHRAEGRPTISVHVNKGRSLSKTLRAELKRDGEMLKAYIFDLHDRQAAEAARVEAAMVATASEDPRC